mgnify:CR=1 FL=1
MLAAVDVSYREDKMAVAAAVVFKQFSDDRYVSNYTAVINQFGKYIPGQFFKRELPCLMAVLSKIKEELETVIIDGYVMLGDRPGLGFYLWEKFDRKISIIGVAKTQFTSANPIKIFR